jgi:hypothetical protein
MSQTQPKTQTDVAVLAGIAANCPSRPKSKAGRPPKAQADKQCHSITVRLTDAEHERAIANAKASGLPLGEIARRGLLKQKINVVPLSVAPDLVAINRIGNVLHQYRKQIVGYANGESPEGLNLLIDKIEEVREQLLAALGCATPETEESPK